jgi:hypothetical protein
VEGSLVKEGLCKSAKGNCLCLNSPSGPLCSQWYSNGRYDERMKDGKNEKSVKVFSQHISVFTIVVNKNRSSKRLGDKMSC